jgi:hypothetical protein
MGTSRLYGYNDEYYSYALYCLIKDTGKYNVEYKKAKGWEDIDYQIKATEMGTGKVYKIKYKLMLYRGYKILEI